MRNPSKLFIVAAVMAALALAPQAASAANTTGSFGVSATVINNCVLTAPGAVNLGNYDPTSASQVSSTATMQVKCTKSTVYTTTLDSGNAWNLHSSSGDVPYKIYQPKSDGTGDTTTQWTNSSGPQVTAGSNANRSMVATVQPSIGVDVPAGTYSDTVTITVAW